MIRKVCIALAVVAVAASVSPAFAGGRSSGGGGKANYAVRVKNNGTAAENITVVSGSEIPASPKVYALGVGNVKQVNIKKGAFIVAALDASNAPIEPTLSATTSVAKTIYVLAASDGSTATVNFAPAGTKF